MRFLLIDSIVEWEPGVRAKGVKNIALSEDFFDDHFPRTPIMPGVLILEGMAQLGGIFLEETVKEEMGIERKALMTIIDKTKFRDISRPGDQLFYEAFRPTFNEIGGRINVEATKNGKKIVSTRFTFVFEEMTDAHLKRDRERLLALWKEGLDAKP